MKKLKELTDKIAAEHGLEWYQPLNKAEDSAGMTAIDLGNGYSLHHEHSENGHDIWSVGCNGERAGTFMLRTEDTRRGKPMVAWAGLEKAHRGKGIGTLAYKALAAHYGGLDSDKASSSDDAIKAWLRAGGRQMKIKTQFGKPRYTLDGDKKNPPIVWNEDLGKNNFSTNTIIQKLQNTPNRSDFEQILRNVKNNKEDANILLNYVDEHNKKRGPYFHGTPKYKEIKQNGFKNTTGLRSGFMGATIEVENQGNFLTNSLNVAHFFGKNRAENNDYEVLSVIPNVQKTLDLTSGKVPSSIIKHAQPILREWDGIDNSRKRTLNRNDIWWLLDKPKFINVLKDLGYDSVKFKEEKNVLKLADAQHENDAHTLFVINPEKLKIHKKINTMDDLYNHFHQNISIQKSYNPSHSLHLINKFEGSDFAPTEFHYSVKSNGKEIGRAIVFDKDPRSIHQAGKTGPSLKDIRLHPDYQGQGHSQGIINKLVDMHGPLASDSRGNISPAGAKMFYKYGIKQPDESYILHGQSESLKKDDESYRIAHTAPTSDGGSPLHNLKDTYPDDIYSHEGVRYYGHGVPYDHKAISVIHAARNKPNAKVRIYRAVPKTKTNVEKIQELEQHKKHILKHGTMPNDALPKPGGGKWNDKSEYYEYAHNTIGQLKELFEEAVPKKLKINTGDWVATTREYAKEHGDSVHGKGNYEILSAVVPAAHVWTDGNSIHEWGYDPTPLKKSIENLIKGFKSQWGGTLPDTDNSHVERNEWWHGTPSGRFPLNNIHVGSKRAAHEALTAKIGHPVEGEWDGTREYGKTLLAGRKTLEAKGIPITGYSVDAPLEDHYPTGKATYSDGTQIALSEKPTMLRFKIKGKMTSHPHAPRTDMAANAIMNRKGIKRGIYYVNEGEDPGSISAVVPSAEHFEQINNSSIKKSSNIDSLIQQAKARLEGIKKVGSQEPRPMIFASKDKKKHAFVTVDPSKKGQWRVTHFVNSKPAGHSEAPTFSHAIKVAHESGYNVFKEIPEEELFKTESLIKGAHPSDLRRITNKTNPKAQEIVDAAPHAGHAPDQAYIDFLNHPTVQKGLGKRDIGGISAKMVHKVGDDTYMAKPYYKKIESGTRVMNPHPISGWSTIATKNLFHSAGIGHLCEDVAFHEHNGVPMTVHKFAKQAYNANAYGWRPDLVKNHIDTQGKQIAIMDFLTNNRDRHIGNVLFNENGNGDNNNLLAIDHERNFQYNQNFTENPNSYIKSIGLQYTQQNPNNPSFAGDQATKDWWKANKDNIVNSFNKDIQSIKDPHLKNHIHTNFMKRVGWLDEYSDPDHLDFFDDAAVPVEMFKERRPKTDYKAIMKNLPENPYKAIGVIDGLFSKKLSFATKETLADLWNEQVDKMSGEEVGNYLKDIQKTKNHPHPKGAYWSLMNRLAEKNHRQGMQHLVQNNMIDLPYWKNLFEARLKLGGVKQP